MSTIETETKLCIGKSSNLKTFEAVDHAVKMALEKCDQPCFGVIFSTHHYNAEEIATALNKRLKSIPWAGCTSAGVFANNDFLDQGLVVGLISSREFDVGVGAVKLDEHNSRQAGAQAVSIALKHLGKNDSIINRSLIILADAKVGNLAEVIRGAVQEAGLLSIWAGGGIGNVSDSKSAEFAHGQAYTEHLIVIAMGSRRPTAIGMGHGWHPYGLPTMVTRSHGSVIEELEYNQAFEIYRRTAADRGEGIGRKEFGQFAMTHPLGIPQADGNYIIRDPISVLSDGSLKFMAEVPDGCLVRMMEGSTGELLKAAQCAAESAKQLSREIPIGAFIFDCISRYLLLNRNYKMELDTFRKGLGEQTPFVGCLTLGEVGAFGNGIPQFHNKASVIMTLHG